MSVQKFLIQVEFDGPLTDHPMLIAECIKFRLLRVVAGITLFPPDARIEVIPDPAPFRCPEVKL